MAGDPPPLRLVDADGQLAPDAPQTLPEALARIDYLEDQLAGANSNVASMRGIMANLKREVAGEIDEDHAMFPAAVAHFRYWCEQCDHPKMEFTPDRMALVLPFIKRHPPADIRQAIRGAAFDPFTVTRKNGSKHRHNGWHQVFASEDKFQDFRSRAPGYRPPTFAEMTLMEAAADVAARILERARLIEDASDPPALAHLLIEVDKAIHRWRESPKDADAEAPA